MQLIRCFHTLCGHMVTVVTVTVFLHTFRTSSVEALSLAGEGIRASRGKP